MRFCMLGLLVENDYYIYQSKLLPQQFWSSVIWCHYQGSFQQFDPLQVQHLWCNQNSQVKVILDFTIESVRDWTLCSFGYVRYPTDTIKMFCQRDNSLVLVPFAANDVFRILEITFKHGNFLIFKFWLLFSIWLYYFYGVNSIHKTLIDQWWAISKVAKKQRAISLF